ncbi:hypothetical protein AgCh_031103 [Apium graveolens]
MAFATDEERLANKPDDIPAEDFKLLLKYWGDLEIQKKKLVADAQASDVQESDVQESDVQASDAHASDVHDVKALKNPTPNPSDACLQELTKKIRQDVVEEVEEKFNRKLSYEVAKVKKVQDNVSLVLRKLLEANPGLNIDTDQI